MSYEFLLVQHPMNSQSKELERKRRLVSNNVSQEEKAAEARDRAEQLVEQLQVAIKQDQEAFREEFQSKMVHIQDVTEQRHKLQMSSVALQPSAV